MNDVNSSPNSETVHLSDEAIALYAEALVTGRINKLTKSMMEHVEECTYCKKEIIELYEIIKDNNIMP